MALGDVLSGIGGLANTAYNLYTNKRDFDYQKALQQTMFEREDTAVQRRMADLQAAGINPNLAAGSAASAGAVVSRSNTNDVNMGSALDMIQAVSQIKGQKIQNDILKQDKQIKIYEKNMARMKEEASAYQYDYENDFMRFLYGNDERIKYNSPRLYEYFNNLIRDQKNSSDILQKTNDWYTANQVINAVGAAAGVGINGFNAYTNANKTKALINRWR